MTHRLALLALPLCLVLLPVAFGLPDEAVGRVVSVISGDSLGIEMLIADTGTNGVDSIKLADIASPSTITAEGKAAQSYSLSLLKNKMVYLDINNNTSDRRTKWNQLVCVIYLVDPEFRPVWPPVNRIIVDRGYARLNDDPNNEFNSSAWWQKPQVFLPSKKREMLTAMLEKRLKPEEMFLVEPLSSPADAASFKSTSNTTNGTTTVSAVRDASASNATKVAPASNLTKATPVSGEAKVAPASNATKITPASGATKIIPASNVTKVTPVSGEAKVAPVSNATKVTQASAATKIIPASNATKVTPVSGAAKVAPASNVTKVTPASGAAKITPASNLVKDTSTSNKSMEIAKLSSKTGTSASLAIPANSTSGAVNATSVCPAVPVNSTSHIVMENTTSHGVLVNSTSRVVPGIPKTSAVKSNKRSGSILEKDKASGCVSIGYRT